MLSSILHSKHQYLMHCAEVIGFGHDHQFSNLIRNWKGGAFFDRKSNFKINFLLIFMAESVENLKNIDFIQCQKSTRCKNLITSCALCNIRIFSHSRGVSNLMSYLHQHLSLESYACPLSRHLRCFM